MIYNVIICIHIHVHVWTSVHYSHAITYILAYVRVYALESETERERVLEKPFCPLKEILNASLMSIMPCYSCRRRLKADWIRRMLIYFQPK